MWRGPIPSVWGPKRAGGRGEMATGAVGPGTCISPPWSADPLLREVGLSDLSSAALSLLWTFGPPSLSYGLPPPPAPLGWPWSLRSLSLRSLPGCPYGTSSSRSFGVAVRRCAPTRLSLWDILLPPLWGGRIPVLALRATSSSLATLRPSRPWCATSAASQSQASWRVSPPMGGSEVRSR